MNSERVKSGLGERMGTHKGFVYDFAHTLLSGDGIDYPKLKVVCPEFAEEIAEAIRVLRRNVPKYRDVKIPGLDED